MVLSRPFREVLPPDTEAVLLLCGNFTSGGGSAAKPLTLAEYNALALWLGRHGRRPADLLRAGEGLLPNKEPGLPPAERARALLERGVQMAAALERWERLGLWVIGRGEDRYPERLRRVLRAAAPALLFGAGDVARLARGGLAIVGSRDIDEEGITFTQRVAQRCAGENIQVISGGARGVDRAAVAAALDAGGGALTISAERLDRVATSRDAKEPLRRGQLTLVSPYEPESGFTVGRAMGRNKHVYALADYALVVRFTTGEGGTWAGAIERLRQNTVGPARVPVFVRVAHNPEAGWLELHNQGALPFPEEEPERGNFAEVLKRAAALSSEAPATAPSEITGPPPLPNGSAETTPSNIVPPEGAAQSPGNPEPVLPVGTETDTCYSRCLPLLLQHLHDEPSHKQFSEIANRLEVLPGQVKEWLKRAVQEGKVKKKKKNQKVVYVDASKAEDATLFDRGEDAA